MKQVSGIAARLAGKHPRSAARSPYFRHSELHDGFRNARRGKPEEGQVLAGMIIVAMLVGLLATSIALAASLPLGVALLLYPAAGSVFLMAVIALRMGLAASAADLPAAARPSRAR